MSRSEPARAQATEADLGPCRARRFERGGDRWAIVLPGANYPTTAPLLWFAREAALEAGRNVLALDDTYDGTTDPQRWVEDRADAAIAHIGGGAPPIIVAKSITSRAAPLAARLGTPAVWVTPLIGEGRAPSPVVDGLAAATAPFLLIGGSADPTWDADRARSFARGEVLEIADADHVLQVPGDAARSIDALRAVNLAIAEFIGAIDGTLASPGGDLAGLDHVQLAMPAGGEERARDFYGSILGLTEVNKPGSLAPRGGCWFVGSAIHLHLGVSDPFEPATKAHPAFRVGNLAALRARLASAGALVGDDSSMPDLRRFYAADPFGNRLEFVEDADAGFTARR